MIEPYRVRSTDVTHAVIEIFGGDNDLSEFIIEDLREMARGLDGNFAVLALADLYGKDASVVEITRHGARVIESVGETDTGDPETLANFLARALVSHRPETRRAIGFWDHGSGVFDEYDPDEDVLARRLRGMSRRGRPRARHARRLFTGALASLERAMLHDDTNGGALTNREASGVLEAAFERARFPGKVDLVFSDTCLNGMVEVAHQFRHYAHALVGSEDLEPGDGWDYEKWFFAMSKAPPANADAWAAQAVTAFEEGYKARPQLHPCTLGAFRADNQIAEAFRGVVATADTFGKDGFSWMRDARDFSQSFDNYDSHDIWDFARRLGEIATEPSVKTAAAVLTNAFDAACIQATALGDAVSDAHGLAFWFPPNRSKFRRDAGTYSQLDFSKATGWVEYLRAHYQA